MNPVPYTTAHFNLSRTSQGAMPLVPRKSQATTSVERFFLMILPVLIPLENYVPSVGGTSFMFFIFVLVTGYVFLKRLTALNRTWLHATFRSVYVLLIVSFLIESTHANSSYYEIFQTGLMIAAAIVVASLCRDRKALRACVYGYLIAGVYMSAIVFFTTYGALSGASATDFDEASTIRAEATKGINRDFNLNQLSRISAEGATVAMALALTARSSLPRNLLLAASLFCTIGAFLPMSRSGIMMFALSCAAVLGKYGFNLKVVTTGLVLGAGLVIVAPQAIFSRLTFSTEVKEGTMEGRAQVYVAAVEHFPEYALTGVGQGNFWGSWGFLNGFRYGRGVLGAHNSFFQATIYWGLGGFLALIAVIFQAYRCLPKNSGVDSLGLCVFGLAIAEFVWLLSSHGLYLKEYSLALGLLVGARCWIWPQGTVPSPRRSQSHSPSSLHIYDKLFRSLSRK